MFLRIKAGVVILMIFIGLSLTAEYLKDEFQNPTADFMAVVEFESPPFVETVFPTSASRSTFEKVRVQRVVDGDTIKLNDGRTVRYIGIDTPETVHPNKSVECFGLEASQANRDLVEGKEIWLEKDVSETDRFGRLLRYVYFADPMATSAAETVMTSAQLVALGFALASDYPPDVKHEELFSQLELHARTNKLGLWGADCRDQ